MDHRDIANNVYWPYRVDEKAKQIILFPDDEAEIILPLEWGVCPTCRGKGSHVNPSIDSHGLTAEDFAEDPDFAESYMRGTYDVPCHECKGLRVVPTSTDPRFIKAVNEAYDDAATDLKTRQAESGYQY